MVESPLQGESAFSAPVDSEMDENVGRALGLVQFDLPMMDLGLGQAHLKRARCLGPKRRRSAEMEPGFGAGLSQGKVPNLSSLTSPG